MVTVVQSGMYMILPWMLKEIQRLANLEQDTSPQKNTNFTSEQGLSEISEKFPVEEPQKTKDTEFYMERFFSFGAPIPAGDKTVDKEPQKMELDALHREYKSFLAHASIFFIINGGITYWRQMLVIRILQSRNSLLGPTQ